METGGSLETFLIFLALTFVEFGKEKKRKKKGRASKPRREPKCNHSPNNDTGILRQSLDNHDGFVPRERKEPNRGLLHPD